MSDEDWRDVLRKLPKKIEPVDQGSLFDDEVENIIEVAPRPGARPIPDRRTEVDVPNRKKKVVRRGQKRRTRKKETMAKKNNKKRDRAEHNGVCIDGISIHTYNELFRLAYWAGLRDDVFVTCRAAEAPRKNGRWTKKIHRVKKTWAATYLTPAMKAKGISRNAGIRILEGGALAEKKPGQRARRHFREKLACESLQNACDFAGVVLPVMPPENRDPTVPEMVQIILDRGDQIPENLWRRIAKAMAGETLPDNPSPVNGKDHGARPSSVVVSPDEGQNLVDLVEELEQERAGSGEREPAPQEKDAAAPPIVATLRARLRAIDVEREAIVTLLRVYGEEGTPRATT